MPGIPTSVSGNGADSALSPLFGVDESWVQKILEDVEKAINQLIDEFRKNPYLHRVEHSLHCELYGLLVASGVLGKTEDYGLVRPRRVQKEWPETIPRQKEDGTLHKRGNFDLVVLGPPENGKSSSMLPDQFKRGLIKPGIVIEIGLDYDVGHLDEDFKKLMNSKVCHGYLIHLSRRAHHAEHSMQWIREFDKKKNRGIKIAYAQQGKDGQPWQYRKLGKNNIHS